MGEVGKFNYQFLVTTGLTPIGFSDANWIQTGSQTMYESVSFSNPAVSARLEYVPVKGLKLGLSGYFANKTYRNTPELAACAGFDGGVTIGSADVTFRKYNAIFRANVLYGRVEDEQS